MDSIFTAVDTELEDDGFQLLVHKRKSLQLLVQANCEVCNQLKKHTLHTFTATLIDMEGNLKKNYICKVIFQIKIVNSKGCIFVSLGIILSKLTYKHT